MRAPERRLAYFGALAALLLPGGALVVGAICLYRRLARAAAAS